MSIQPFRPLAVPAARIVERLAARRDCEMRHPHAVLAPRVRRMIALGAAHPEVRLRYGVRAQMLADALARVSHPVPLLDAAVAIVDRWRHLERVFEIANAFGRGSRVSLDVLCELHLILRLARRRRWTDRQFLAVLAALMP